MTEDLLYRRFRLRTFGNVYSMFTNFADCWYSSHVLGKDRFIFKYSCRALIVQFRCMNYCHSGALLLSEDRLLFPSSFFWLKLSFTAYGLQHKQNDKAITNLRINDRANLLTSKSADSHRKKLMLS